LGPTLNAIPVILLQTSKDDGGFQLVNQYRVLRMLGRGMYGKVKLVQNIHDNQFYVGFVQSSSWPPPTVWTQVCSCLLTTQQAMKIMSKSLLKRRGGLARNRNAQSNQWENAKREIAIMKKLHHPNVVRLFEVIDDDENDKLYLGACMKPGVCYLLRHCPS